MHEGRQREDQHKKQLHKWHFQVDLDTLLIVIKQNIVCLQEYRHTV